MVYPSVTKLCYVQFFLLLALLSLFRGSFLLSQTKMLLLEGKNINFFKKVKQNKSVNPSQKPRLLKQCAFVMHYRGIFRMFLSFRTFFVKCCSLSRLRRVLHHCWVKSETSDIRLFLFFNIHFHFPLSFYKNFFCWNLNLTAIS